LGGFWVNKISRAWWFRKLHIGYALMEIFVRFTCVKNNANMLAYAGLRVNLLQDIFRKCNRFEILVLCQMVGLMANFLTKAATTNEN